MAIGWCILLSQANSLILLFSFLDILSSTKSSSRFLILSRILPRIQHSFQRMLPSAFYTQHSQVLWFCLIQGCEKLSESLLWGEHCPLQNPGQVCTGNFGPCLLPFWFLMALCDLSEILGWGLTERHLVVSIILALFVNMVYSVLNSFFLLGTW